MMPELTLSKLKTKNKKKDKVVSNPAQIPLIAERQYHAEIRAYNNRFKEVVREILFPMINNMSALTKDSFTTDGIGEEFDRQLEALIAMFNFSKISEGIASKMVSSVSSVNEKKIAKSIENSVGVNVGEIIKSENLSEFVELQSINNAKLIKSVPEDAIKDIRRIVLNGLAEGKTGKEITKLISGTSENSVFNKMNNRIKVIARTETAKINSQITNKRLTKLGIEKAVWDAVNDDRVRKCHWARNGEVYSIKKGLYSSCDGKTIQPGQEINCRCVARAIIE